MRTRAAPIALSLVLVACGFSAASPGTADPGTGTAVTAPSSPTPPSPSPQPSPSDSPRAARTTGSLSIAWSEQEFDAPVSAVIADRDRFVAVGGLPESLTAWTSTDGLSWDALPIPGPSTEHCRPEEPICLERYPVVGPLVRLHDTLYSFGGTQFFNDAALGLAWRWTDGQPWQSIQSESEAFKAGPFRAVAASDSALFAVTHAGYPGTEQHWLWTADASWRRVGEPISSENPIQINSVAWGDGRFVAVGNLSEANPDTPYFEWAVSPAAWVSTDGSTWIDASPPPEVEALCTVRAFDDFFAFGTADGVATVWRSTDGENWMRGDLPGADGIAGCAGNIVEVEGGLVALLGAADRTLVWTSTDGSTWHAGDDLPVPTTTQSVAALGDTIVAFDADPMIGAPVPALYVGSVSVGQP